MTDRIPGCPKMTGIIIKYQKTYIMLNNILSIVGIEQISKHIQKSIITDKKLCKQDRMCAQYGNQCEELACKEVPLFDIDLV